MGKLCAIAVTLILIGAAAGDALAGEPAHSGSARAGREFVGYNCDACHMVAANQDIRPLISGYAPSFSDIANRPGTTPEALRVFLSRQHAYSNMPYPDLAPADLANVVAYIMSLRRSH
ncbi:MAG TPA: cytochrome c [Stellaceae bacterium]|nr:cytochrome c [Stellaceae bacterium]